MTKTVKPAAAMTMAVVEEPVAPVLAPAPVAVSEKPQTVQITETAIRTIHKMSALIRSGYIPESIDVWNATGMMSVTLHLGNPDAAMVEAAYIDVQTARELEEHQRQQEILAAAAQLVADREKAARKAEVEAEIAAQEKALAALRAAAAA